jgi:hopanoid biosynthesis associated RND transporter like protein HpnN
MAKAFVVWLVDLCARRPWWTIVLALTAGLTASGYVARHFAIHTDIRELISPDLPWAQRAAQYEREFPRQDILVVLDAPTPEIADQAAVRLADSLQANSSRFRSVSHPGSGHFFERNGFLFLSTEELKRVTDGLIRADPLLGTLASDPSLRGALNTLTLALFGVERGEINLDQLVDPLSMAADTAEAALAGRPTSFSWRALAADKRLETRDLRRFLQIEPVLDFNALEPGRKATDAVVQAASELGLGSEHPIRVRQTGRVPMDDDEFGSIQQSTGLNAVLSLAAVILILWLALKSLRIMLAVMVTLLVGLAVSAAIGLLMVGALNLLSVAFFVLFIGLGVDFAIQFSVRYRAERHDARDLRTALRNSATKASVPLALAAVATAVGFTAFVPTPYRGLSELGLIAGAGMLVAFAASISLLPALLAVVKPQAEPQPVGFSALAPIDAFLERHRIAVVASTIAVVALGSPLLLFLPFDFNPLHLQSRHLESVATYLELRRDPQAGANAIDIVAANVAAANDTAQRMTALPQVAEARTISSFVPTNQDEKIELIRKTAAELDESLNPAELDPAPSSEDTIEALSSTAARLAKIVEGRQGAGAEAAKRLSRLLSELAEGDPSVRQRAESAVVEPLRFSLDQLRRGLKPEPVSIETIPPDLAREWITPDGHARVEVLPKGDPDDTNSVRTFVHAVLAIEPNATGPAVLLFEAGNTVVNAFVVAGVFAIGAVFILLLITLRRIGDVLLTLLPLIVAGIVTLEICALVDFPLNFANIIALPLLLGVGVAFKIYYIVAWRAGKTRLLQSSLTRAILFSGMTTATAFGSLCLSNHPGTSSMGKLMALSLVCTMAAAVLFQPALMGPPRRAASTPAD